jgi:hypothetical protein
LFSLAIIFVCFTKFLQHQGLCNDWSNDSLV